MSPKKGKKHVPLHPDGLKWCKSCCEYLPSICFWEVKSKRSKPGALRTECKQCVKKRHRAWVEENRDKLLALYPKYKARANERARSRGKSHVESLTDEYVLKALRMKEAPQQLIETKRAHLVVGRFLKETANGKHR